ncbi:MAG: DNA polymerase III subunit [Armatimonadetes bacterium]|nr:DNA polymerase III subunit [Armatimonadota bacterium]
MRFEDLIGHERAVSVLRNALRRDRVAHSYLFSGPEGVGKSTAARIFVQALNCEKGPDESPCGECSQCLRTESGGHPDVRFLTPQPGKSVIAIEDIRKQFVYDVNLKPVLGRYKVYVLDPAEQTAHLAVHTTLKVLEEPPPYVVAILVTSAPASLPATIPSRCQPVAFQLVGARQIMSHLVELGVEAGTAASLANLSGGRIAWAIRASRRPEVLAVRESLLQLCSAFGTRSREEGPRIAEEIKLEAAALAESGESEDETESAEEGEERSGRGAVSDRMLRAELPWCLDIMVSWYRDLLAVREGVSLLNPDYEDLLRRQAGSAGSSGTEFLIEAVLQAKHAIQQNANIDLALEALALDLLGSCE